MSKKKNNPIVNKSFQLAIEIVEYTYQLRDLKEFDLSRQIFKSGTSIGANIREAQGAESRSDFIHKLKIAFKESEELDYWLDLCNQSSRFPSPPKIIIGLLVEIRKLLSSIIASSKKHVPSSN